MKTVAEILAAAGKLEPAEIHKLRREIDRLDKKRRAILLHPSGKVFHLTRLDDAEFLDFWRRSIAIQDDILTYLFAVRQSGKELDLPRAYLTLTELTGPSGRSFDDYKGSFSFPFLLESPKLGDWQYLLEVRDFRGSLEFALRKVLDQDDPRLSERIVHAPFANELSREQINKLILYFHGYLLGRWEGLETQFHQPFLNQVHSNLVLYGYHGGRCFEEHYDSMEAYEVARKKFQRLIKEDRKDGGKAS